MSVLAEETVASGDISSYLEILSYTNDTGRDLAILAKVEVGSVSKPLAGNGNYELKISIDDVEILPTSLIKVGSQPYVAFQSRHLSLQQSQVLTIQVKGQGADTDTAIEVVVVDVTPVLVSDLGGTGAIPVDHDYGGTDTLRIVDPDGAGIQDATITGYLADDYNAGNRTVNYVRGRTTTSVSGRWRSPLSLDAGSYVLVIAKPPEYLTVVQALTVSN